MASGPHTILDPPQPDSGIADDDDNESTLSSDLRGTGSVSITASIYGYEYENGRRYHAYRAGAYYLPNDEMEQARLDLVHHIFRLALDGALYLSPLSPNITRALDFGTGTGIWAIDFADEFPSAEVLGTDLSPIQPSNIPPNLRFYIDDAEDPWSYRPDEAFDFIHGRQMGGSIKDWNFLFKQAYDNLKPGGWFEMHEYEGWVFSITDPTLSKAPNVKLWVEKVNEGSSRFGKAFDMGPQLKELMQTAGFVNVRPRVEAIPIGTWARGRKPKEIGAYQREHMCECVDAFTISLFTRVLGWKVDECQVLMAHCSKCIER